jgi:TetR/AcrR family transcriptional regulator
MLRSTEETHMPKLTAIRKQALDEMMKSALFEATVAVLVEHGVEGMTMDRVATAAGVAKGSLYHYFRSKGELLEFVYGKSVDPLLEHLESLLAVSRPAVDKLAAHLRMFLEHVAEHVQVFQLLFHDVAAQSLLESTARSTREVARQRMAEIFRQGIAEGAFRPGDPGMLATMFLGLCRAVLDTQPDLGQADQRDEIHRLIMGTFLNGIAAPQAGSRDCEGKSM